MAPLDRLSLAANGRVAVPDFRAGPPHDRYKWVALSNTTLGSLMATIDASITLIALPAIFRGVGMDPLAPGNSFYLLWMILGFLVVTSVLVVSLGRLGDMYGRTKMYNLGFAIFTFFSLLLTITWMKGDAGAMWLIVMRIFQGVGAACLLANASAILTDAFPPNQRGMALGINQMVGICGVFIGLVLGGLLAPIDWRMVFLVSVPVGLAGTIWAYLKLREVPRSTKAKIDWAGNVTFALGLVAIMTGVTYGIRPYGNHAMGWTSPTVLVALGVGIGLLAAFVYIELHVRDPMFRIQLFRIRAFSAGSTATLLSAIGRGGLMFLLIMWLQGIWLPEHGYNFSQTPLWAAIYMLPLTLGVLIAGPTAGILSDRYGPRPFTFFGMVGAAASFALLAALPVNFPYWAFFLVLLFSGLTQGGYASPNRAAVMNALPPEHRGVGSGMNSTFQNSGQVFSIGIFFSLMIIGLAATLSTSLHTALLAHGLPVADANRIAHLPPVSVLFAAFLGYNPIQHLAGTTALHHVSAAQASYMTSRGFFPTVIQSAFEKGMHFALYAAVAACLIAAVCSILRGGKYVHEEIPAAPAVAKGRPAHPTVPAPVVPVTASAAQQSVASG
jgi:MFS family permease